MDEIIGLLFWFVRILIIDIIFYAVFYWIGLDGAYVKFSLLGSIPILFGHQPVRIEVLL